MPDLLFYSLFLILYCLISSIFRTDVWSQFLRGDAFCKIGRDFVWRVIIGTNLSPWLISEIRARTLVTNWHFNEAFRHSFYFFFLFNSKLINAPNLSCCWSLKEGFKSVLAKERRLCSFITTECLGRRQFYITVIIGFHWVQFVW